MKTALQVLVSPIVAVVMSPLRFARFLIGWTTYWTATRARRVRALTAFLVFTVAVIGSRTSRLDLRYASTEMERAEVVETSFLPPPFILKTVALGYNSFVADMLFMRANMYFVSHLFRDRIFTWLDLYLESILALDPDNPTLYAWASQTVKFGQSITNAHLERSNRYSQLGIERYPDNWRFYFDIGFNYHHEWRTEDPEERQAMRDKALPYFSLAAALPDSKMDPNFLTELHLQRNDVEMALLNAYQRYWQANDREKEELRRRIARFESEAAANRLADTETVWKNTYPYLPLGLFELVGARADAEATQRQAPAPRSSVN